MDGREHEGRCQELPGGEGPERDLQAVQCPGGDVATEGDWCSGDGGCRSGPPTVFTEEQED